MAHWIIEDHGFGGQYYKCSECGHTFNDLYHDVPDDICPECGVEINENENEYAGEKESECTHDFRLLTNKEAAGIIKNILEGMMIPRGCGKTMTILRRVEALSKAVHVLENTPDEE